MRLAFPPLTYSSQRSQKTRMLYSRRMADIRRAGPRHEARVAGFLIAALDLLIVALVLAGGAAGFGAYRFVFLGARVSVSSPWRSWLLAALLLALRAWLAPLLPALRRLYNRVQRPVPFGEARLFEFESAPTLARRGAELAAVFVGFAVLVAAFTWPQVRHMGGVPDLGDPLFSIWRIAWVNHQIWRDPLTLFDANIFHPERLTFTYSDPVIVPALMSAPLFWLGVPAVSTYNLLLLSGFVLSGVATYYLVRALTGRRDAAAIAGVIFALHPYRFEHYSHLELQMTMWMPVALWSLHRTMARGGLGDGLVTGLAYALQVLSSLYYGMYFALYLLVVGAALWVGRRLPLRPLGMLAAGAALAGALVAPVASQDVANRPMMGDRGVDEVKFYSAESSDYLKAHPRSYVYERWSRNGHPERQLFPRVTPVLLALVGVCPPLSFAQVGYAAALAVSFDGSRGMNGYVFPWLRENVPGFSGLRVPARFSILVGLSLAILSGYGAARLFDRWPRARVLLAVAMLGPVLVEAVPNISLEDVWPQPPAIYDALTSRPDAVVAEFPMPSGLDHTGSDARYEYF